MSLLLTDDDPRILNHPFRVDEFRIWRLEAWADGEGGWTINDRHAIGRGAVAPDIAAVVGEFKNWLWDHVSLPFRSKDDFDIDSADSPILNAVADGEPMIELEYLGSRIATWAEKRDIILRRRAIQAGEQLK